MIVGALLAAGRSQRFGADDKLLAPLHGKPLIAHAAATLAALPLDLRMAVVSSAEVEACLAGFTILRNDAPERGLSRSLACAAAAAIEAGATRLLILLADMPRVTPAHCLELLTNCRDARAAASFDGIRVSPPACFPASALAALQRMTGDKGAREMLASLPPEALVRADAHTLIDVDTHETLQTLASD